MRKTKVKRLRKQFLEEVGRKPDKSVIKVNEVKTLRPDNKGKLVEGKMFAMEIVKKNEFRRYKKERRKNG